MMTGQIPGLEHKPRGRHGALRWRIEGDIGVIGTPVGLDCGFCAEYIRQGETHVAQAAIKTTSKMSRVNGQLGPLSVRTFSDPGDDANWYHLRCLPINVLREWAGYQTVKAPTKRAMTAKQFAAALGHPKFNFEPALTESSEVAPTTHAVVAKVLDS